MNLTELYKQTPVERHKDISIVGNRIFLKQPDGSLDEYIIVGQGTDKEELWLLHSDKELRQDISALKTKLGIA